MTTITYVVQGLRVQPIWFDLVDSGMFKIVRVSGKQNFAQTSDHTVPIQIDARFKDNPGSIYRFEIDKSHLTVSGPALGVGILITGDEKLVFYESKRGKRRLTVKFTEKEMGPSQYLTEQRAGKRLADPQNASFSPMFVNVLIPEQERDSQVVGTPQDEQDRPSMYIMTVMEAAPASLDHAMEVKRNKEKLTTSDVSVVVAFITSVYDKLALSGYYYKDMRIDHILYYGVEFDEPIRASDLKLGDVGNLCKIDCTDEQCGDDWGVFNPIDAMNLTFEEKLNWQKYMAISMVFLNKGFEDLFMKFKADNKRPLSEHTFFKAHEELVFALKYNLDKYIDADVMKRKGTLAKTIESSILFFQNKIQMPIELSSGDSSSKTVEPGTFEIVNQPNGEMWEIIGNRDLKTPIEIVARFKNDSETYSFTIDRKRKIVSGGFGKLIFYKAIGTSRGLVIKFTDYDDGNAHYYPETRAGKRLADPRNENFAHMFVEVLNPSDGRDSVTLSFYAGTNRNERKTLTLTVMERAARSLHDIIIDRRDDGVPLSTQDITAIATFITQVYSALSTSGFFYKDMKIDQILYYGSKRNERIDSSKLKVGDLGNLCAIGDTTESCEEDWGLFDPIDAMNLSIEGKQNWQKHMIISRVVLSHTLYDHLFADFHYETLTEDTFIQAHESLVRGLRTAMLENHTMKNLKFDDPLQIMITDAATFFSNFHEPIVFDSGELTSAKDSYHLKMCTKDYTPHSNDHEADTYQTNKIHGPYSQDSLEFQQFSKLILGKPKVFRTICQGYFLDYVKDKQFGSLKKNENLFGVYILSAFSNKGKCDQTVGFLLFREVRVPHMHGSTLFIHTELVCNSQRHTKITGAGGMAMMKELERCTILHGRSGLGTATDGYAARKIDTIQFSLDALTDELAANMYGNKLNYSKIHRYNSKTNTTDPYLTSGGLIPMVKQYVFAEETQTFVHQDIGERHYKIDNRKMTATHETLNMYDVVLELRR